MITEVDHRWEDSWKAAISRERKNLSSLELESECCLPALSALRALGKIGENETSRCNECPFPFCLRSEVRVLYHATNIYIKTQLVDGMKRLGMTVDAIGKELNISQRSVARYYGQNSMYSKRFKQCHWCNLDAMTSGIFCRTSICTVTFDEDSVVVLLSSHRKASKSDYSAVELLVENMIPDAVIKNGGDDEHSHWTIETDEAKEIYRKMEFLNTFSDKLRGHWKAKVGV